MARTLGDIATDVLGQDVGSAFGDLSKHGDLPLEEKKFRPRAMPEDPSESRSLDKASQQLWRQLMPQIESNSSSEEEFAANMRIVLKALFKRQFKAEPSGDEMAELEKMTGLPLHMYRQSKPPSDQQLNRRQELDDYQREFMEGSDGGR